MLLYFILDLRYNEKQKALPGGVSGKIGQGVLQKRGKTIRRLCRQGKDVYAL